MPKPLQYYNNSLIYCKGEESDKVFLLQSGSVNLVSEDIETGDNVRETVQPGEFFGVRSALGRYPRDENALVLSEATVSVFTVPEFELYAMSDTKFILDLLKVFSGQMRQIHTRIAVLSKTDKLKPETGLFGIGERYLKKKQYSHAKYIFSRYLTHYPEGRDAAKAAINLHLAETGLARAEQGIEEPSDEFNPANAYYNALNFIKSEKYGDALHVFTQVANSEDTIWAAKGIYEIGRCLYFMNKYEECIKHYQHMILLHPKHQDIKDAMYYVGQAYERIGKKTVAAAWYKKIIALPFSDNDKTRSKTIQALEALGG
jgi:TolA-binding protein